MTQRMSPRMHCLYVNMGIVLGLVWCYLKRYSATIILTSGLFVLLFANGVLYFKYARKN
jgi:hypothetical protein